MKQKTLILAALMLLMTMPMYGQTIDTVVTGGRVLYFSLDGSSHTASLTNWSYLNPSYTPSSTLVIPETVSHGGTAYSVTAINATFQEDSILTTVTIPSTITYIVGGGFLCPYLTTVNYNAVSMRGYDLFIGLTVRYDYSLDSYVYDTVIAPITTLNIGSSVRNIPGFFMDGITTLNTINIPSNSSLDTIGSYAFQNTGITSITIPDSVRYIGSSAFACPNLTTVNYNAIRMENASYNCCYTDYFECHSIFHHGVCNHYHEYRSCSYDTVASITSFNIGSSVKVIPPCLMMGIGSLTSVSIPASVDTIGPYAFENTGLTTITIPEGIKTIGCGAFTCPNLTSLNYNARHVRYGWWDEYSHDFLDGGCAFLSGINDNGYIAPDQIAPITNVTIGDSVQYIPDYFLYKDTMLTALTIPNHVRRIGQYAFANTRLTAITIPTSVETIRTGAFNGTSLTSLIIPATLDTIGESAFTCATLDSVHYNAVNLYYGGGGCPFMKETFDEQTWNTTIMPQTLTIGSDVRVLPNFIFSNMNISSVTLPDSLQSIGEAVFYDTRLTSITIPDRVTTIGAYAFAQPDPNTWDEFSGVLRRVVIGQNVSSIGNYAFAGITNPDTIFMRPTVPPTIANHTFDALPTNAVIMLPCGTSQSYQNASYWNSFTRMQEDPSCFNLVTVLANNTSMGSVGGGGRYSTGQVATLSAMPRNNHAFVGWADGSVDNPRLVLVTGDTTYTANFSASGSGTVVHDTVRITDTLIVTNTDTVVVTNTDTVLVVQYDTIFISGTDTIYLYDTIYLHDTVYINPNGITDVQGGNAQIYQHNGQLVVEGAAGNIVTLYDTVGRLLATKHDDRNLVIFDLPSAGVYLVKIGDAPARKIVVMK